MKRLSIFFIGLLFLGSCVDDEDLVEPAAGPTGTSSSSIVINEVVSSGDDMIELYNTSSESEDIGGFVISDSADDFVLPTGTTVAGNGYLILLADGDDFVDASGIHTNFKISSSNGELITLTDGQGGLVDQVDVPPLSAGVSWGRTSDGAETYAILTPSIGSSNSNENSPPTLTATAIESLNDNTRTEFTVNAVDATGIRDVKLFLEYDGGIEFLNMAPVGDGDFKQILPQFSEGQEVEYYVVATDESGLTTFFPDSAPDDGLELTVENGFPIISDVEMSTESPAGGEEVTFTANIFDVTGFDNVRLYFVIDDQVADDKTRINMTDLGDNIFEATIPGQPENTVVSYYIRAEDASDQKTFFPGGDDFDDDLETTWPSYIVSPPVILDALVLNEIQGGGDPDYIELFNGTSGDIDISGYQLQDKDPEEAFTIPVGTVIPAGGFWVLDADGDAVTLFKISSGGEDITLLDPSGNIVDQLLEDDWPEDHDGLVGRVPDGADKWSIMSEESKGTTNGN